MKMRVPPLIGG